MKHVLNGLALAVMAGALATGAYADTLTFPPGQLSPAPGDLSGYDGDLVTWGLVLYNSDPVNWWVIVGVTSDYTFTGGAGEIPADANFFTDLLSPYFFDNFVGNNTALAPGQDLNLTSPGDPVDLASFAISSRADPGTITAQLHIYYDVWDSNPFDTNNFNAQQIGGDQEFDIDTSVTSLGPNPNSNSAPPEAPEPNPLWLLFTGLLGLRVFWRRSMLC